MRGTRKHASHGGKRPDNNYRSCGPPAGEMKPETALSRITPDNILLSFKTNAIGPILVCQRFVSLLERAASADGADASGGAPAVVANMSARVGSITDNGLGGWYSYRCASR